MMPKNGEYLFVAANLTHVDKRWGFSIKMMKWRFFLEGHRFTTINCDCTFEVDVKKVDLNAFIEGEYPKHREKVNFIRIGVLKASPHKKVEMQKDPHDGRMITTPPNDDDEDDDDDDDDGRQRWRRLPSPVPINDAL